MQELNNQIITYEDEGDEISILDILLIIAEGKKIILSFLFLFLLLGLSYGIFIQKPEYVSRMQITLIFQNSPKTGDFNIYANGNLISGIMLSDSVLDQVIDQNNLLFKEHSKKTLSRIRVREGLIDNIDVNIATNGIVTISVKDKSPEKALDITKSLYDFSLIAFKNVAYVISEQKASYLLSEINKSLEQVNRYNKEPEKRASQKEIDELLRAISLFSLYQDASSLKYEAPAVIQLVSAPKLPDQPLPRGRAKTALLSAFLGLFLGFAFVFLRYFWRVSSNDVESKEKINKLKALLGLKNK